MSVFLILMGSTLYTWFKSRTASPPPAAPKADVEQVEVPLISEDAEKETDEGRKVEAQS